METQAIKGAQMRIYPKGKYHPEGELKVNSIVRILGGGYEGKIGTVVSVTDTSPWPYDVLIDEESGALPFLGSEIEVV